MRGYVLSTSEGCLISSVNSSSFFHSDDVLNKFVKFSATLCGMFADQPLVQYQWGPYNCLSASVVNSSFYVTILYCRDVTGTVDADCYSAGKKILKFDMMENKVSKYVVMIILYFYSFPFINDELSRISKSITAKCFENLENGNRVTDINSDINDVVLDEIDETRLLLENFEEHYIYVLLYTTYKEAKSSSQFTDHTDAQTVIPEVDDIPDMNDFITNWYKPLVPALRKFCEWSINVYICMHVGESSRVEKHPSFSVSSFYVPKPVAIPLRCPSSSNGHKGRECDDDFYGYLFCNATAVTNLSVVTLMRCGIELPEKADGTEIDSYVRNIKFLDFLTTAVSSTTGGGPGMLAEVVLRDINAHRQGRPQVVMVRAEANDFCIPNTISPPPSPRPSERLTQGDKPGEMSLGESTCASTSNDNIVTAATSPAGNSFVEAYRLVLRNVSTTFPLGFRQPPPFYYTLPLANLCPIVFVGSTTSVDGRGTKSHPNIFTFEGNAARCFELCTKSPVVAPVTSVNAVGATMDESVPLPDSHTDEDADVSLVETAIEPDALKDSNTSVILSAQSSPGKHSRLISSHDDSNSDSNGNDNDPNEEFDLDTSMNRGEFGEFTTASQYSPGPEDISSRDAIVSNDIKSNGSVNLDMINDNFSSRSSSSSSSHGMKTLLSNTFFKTPMKPKNKVHVMPHDCSSSITSTETNINTNMRHNSSIVHGELLLSNFPSPASSQIPQSASKPIHDHGSVVSTPCLGLASMQCQENGEGLGKQIHRQSSSKIVGAYPGQGKGQKQEQHEHFLTPMPPKPVLGVGRSGSFTRSVGVDDEVDDNTSATAGVQSLSLSHSAPFHGRSGRKHLPSLQFGESTGHGMTSDTPVHPHVPTAPATAPVDRVNSFKHGVAVSTPSPVKAYVPVTNSTPLKVEDL